MRAKYVEESFPKWFIHGEHANGRVTITDGNQTMVGDALRTEADIAIAAHNAAVQRLVDTALAFANASPEEFQKFWYGP